MRASVRFGLRDASSAWRCAPRAGRYGAGQRVKKGTWQLGAAYFVATPQAIRAPALPGRVNVEALRWLLCACSGGLGLAFGVVAVAGDLHPAAGILAVLAAVFAFLRWAVTGGMRAFFLFLLGHGLSLLSVRKFPADSCVRARTYRQATLELFAASRHL